MKIRTDFVTNSSSSSFIIEKTNEIPATVESVYQAIRGFYVDICSKFNNLANMIENGDVSDIKVCKEDRHVYFSYDFKNREKLLEKYGDVIRSHLYVRDFDWVDSCLTYEEYEKYWIKKISENPDNWRNHAPFTIASLNDEYAKFIHICKTSPSPTYEINEGIVEWYKWECEEPVVLNGVCVYSECGYINDRVVSALSKLSKYWCNHMG